MFSAHSERLSGRRGIILELDGEAVVLQKDGRSDFGALMTKRGGELTSFVAFFSASKATIFASVRSRSGETRFRGWSTASTASSSAPPWRSRARSCSPTPAGSALRASCRSGLAADIAAGPAAIGSNARTRSSQELEVTRWAGASSSRRPRYGKKHATFEASFLIVTAHASDQPFEHPAMHANRAAQRWTPVPQQCRNRARR
jgi:hypothetical protein